MQQETATVTRPNLVKRGHILLPALTVDIIPSEVFTNGSALAVDQGFLEFIAAPAGRTVEVGQALELVDHQIEVDPRAPRAHNDEHLRNEIAGRLRVPVFSPVGVCRVLGQAILTTFDGRDSITNVKGTKVALYTSTHVVHLFWRWSILNITAMRHGTILLLQGSHILSPAQ